jgi:hypothetical protein
LHYFTVWDKGIGERALGPEKTVSGRVQETASSLSQQARSVDEQRGISKTAHAVSTSLVKIRAFWLLITISLNHPFSIT